MLDGGNQTFAEVAGSDSLQCEPAVTANNDTHNCASEYFNTTFICSISTPATLKGFPYSLPSVGPGADPSEQAVSPQATISHPRGGRLPLLSARSLPSQVQSITTHWLVSSYTAW